MFGTFVEELAEDVPTYGIVKQIGTFNPLKVAFHEWIAMFLDATQPDLPFITRLRYLVSPPGWQHDREISGSAALKAEYVARNSREAGKPGLPEKA